MSDFDTQIQSDELTDPRPSTQDQADYCDFLDSIGYGGDDEVDDGGDDFTDGFQPWDGDN